MLRLERVAASYQPGLDVVADVSLEAPAGQITAIIGPNGAGKSTLLRAIFGVLPPSRGRVLFRGEPIEGRPPHAIKRAGIGYVPQSGSTFPQLTVEENLLVGAWTIRRDRVAVRERLDRVYGMFPALQGRRRERATVLSGGQQRMLAIAKEMMVAPALLLVDEPTVGLSPKVAAEVYGFLERAPSLGTAVLLVDQNIADAVRIAGHVYMLVMGRVERSGPRERFAPNLHEIIRETLVGG